MTSEYPCKHESFTEYTGGRVFCDGCNKRPEDLLREHRQENDLLIEALRMRGVKDKHPSGAPRTLSDMVSVLVHDSMNHKAVYNSQKHCNDLLTDSHERLTERIKKIDAKLDEAKKVWDCQFDSTLTMEECQNKLAQLIKEAIALCR
jgi:cyclopropane fatty-acyl-phospholipid synthase-like methyltransferase